MTRRWLAVAGFVVLGVCVGRVAAQAPTAPAHVVLVTLDGARHQEVFGGMDVDVLRSTVVEGPVEESDAYRKYWAPTPEARRAKLLPFFWGTLMNEGWVAGNPAAGSTVRITNGHRFSYPGYAELLAGETHDEVIKSNDAVQNPYETVLEFVRRRLNLSPSQVAAFASWQTIERIAQRTPRAITTNAGVQRLGAADTQGQQLDRLQFEARSPWDLVRLDAFTFRLGLAYMKAHRPRLFFFSFDETDDWAHDGKYGHVLDAYARTDQFLRELWAYLQSEPSYRGRTTLIITTDHGRGRTTSTWRSHGRDIDGAEEIWLAVIGPGSVRRGEWRDAPPLYQNQVAATIAQLFGLDFRAEHPEAGRPVPLFSEVVTAGCSQPDPTPTRDTRGGRRGSG